MTPEEKARQKIDAMLVASGWVVQTRNKINLSAARGVANLQRATRLRQSTLHEAFTGKLT